MITGMIGVSLAYVEAICDDLMSWLVLKLETTREHQFILMMKHMMVVYLERMAK